MDKARELEDVLQSLVACMDPYRAGETITLRLQHDSGARLQRDVLSGQAREDVRAAFSDVVKRDVEGLPMYEAYVCGVTVQWPSRRIDLGGGRVEFI
jgi:hypothetical protein